MQVQSMKIDTPKAESHELNFSETGKFGYVAKAFQERDKNILQQIQRFPSLENFAALAKGRKSNYKARTDLLEVLKEQYKGETISEKQGFHLDKLALDSTVTVTTGHQVCFLGGPLYMVYKAMHTIKLADELNATQKDCHVVPIFWMATEDHDFDEIAKLSIFNKSKSLTDSDNLLPVGTYTLQAFKELKEFAYSFFDGFEGFENISNDIDAIWASSSTLSQFTFRLLNLWFGDRGLIVLEPQHPKLKKHFTEVLRTELNGNSIQKSVEEAIEGFQEPLKVQAPPRSCNLFFIRDGKRYRLDRDQTDFSLHPGAESIKKEELLRTLEEHPEAFSPNVILRPVYQELVLPNIAYIGGAGEMAYWLQLPKMFEELNVPFPQLMLRNSFQLVDSGVAKKVHKLDLSPKELFMDKNLLVNQIIASDDKSENLDFQDSMTKLSEAFTQIAQQVANVDPTLKATVEAQEKNTAKAIDGIQKRVKKKLKENQEVKINQLGSILDRLFPNGGLQERHENVLHYLAKHGTGFFELLYQESSAIHPRFKLLYLP